MRDRIPHTRKITSDEVIAAVANRLKMDDGQVRACVDAFLEEVLTCMQYRVPVVIRHFGSFYPSMRKIPGGLRPGKGIVEIGEDNIRFTDTFSFRPSRKLKQMIAGDWPPRMFYGEKKGKIKRGVFE